MKKIILIITSLVLANLTGFGQNKSFYTYTDARDKNEFSSSAKANLAYNKGSTYFDNSEFENAITQFTLAIEDDKKRKIFSPDIYLSRANAYVQTSNYTNAISDFSAIINYKKDTTLLVMALNGRAGVYGYMKDYDKAVYDFQKVLSHNDTDIYVLYNLSRMYLQKEDFKNGLNLALTAKENYYVQKLDNPAIKSGIFFNLGSAKYSLKMNNYCADFEIAIEASNMLGEEIIQFVKNVCP